MKLTLIYSWLFNFLTIYSSNMGFGLAFPLVLTFISTGQFNTEVTDQCYEICPPGYHKTGNCNDTVKKYKCAKCLDGSYTDIENYIEKCQRCHTCGNFQEEIKPCVFNSDVKCECKKDYYYNNKSDVCQPCNCCKELYNNDEYNRKCQQEVPNCQSCLENKECKMKCPTASPIPPKEKGISWLYLVVALVLLVAFLFLLLLCIRNSNNCRRWRVNKDLVSPVQDLKFNEQSSHQGSSENTLILNISEETPMALSQSPAMPEHPAHIRPLLPDAQAARQDEQSERWPAIVLYTIIKEVPLRRWKEFLRLLSVADQQLERVELEAGLGPGSMERQYQMLKLWSQRSSASLNDIFSALHYMDLSGCAQLLQESLEKLPWKPDLKQGFTACKS